MSDMTVGEALDKLDGILVGWSFHAGFPSDDGLQALAVLRSCLAAKPRKVTEREISELGEWIKIGENEFGPMEARMIPLHKVFDKIRELGFEVEEPKP